jgi:hypothetical protein
MSYETYETIQRLWDRFVEGELTELAPAERREVARQLERRYGELLRSAGATGDAAFIDLVGLGREGPRAASVVPPPFLEADFDAAVVPSQLHSAAELYFAYQYQRMGVFRVAAVLQQLFREGRIRIQRGPGARTIYLLDKWQPLRYSGRDRAVAYQRVFNYGGAPRPAGAIINRNFHYQFVALMSALAQYYRDLTIGEVIRGASDIEHRPFGNIATIQRLGTDLRYALDRATYGNIVTLSQETGLYLKQLLELFEQPDIRKAFDANNKWDVVEGVLNQYLGGAKELSMRSKMAESGRAVLLWVSDSRFETSADPGTFQVAAQDAGAHAEAWIAAYRMTEEGRRFPGVTQNLHWALGLPKKGLHRVAS